MGGLLACSGPPAHGSGSTDGGTDARADSGQDGSVDARPGKDGGGGGGGSGKPPPMTPADCIEAGVIPAEWTIDIGFSWVQTCAPGSEAEFSESSNVTASFRIDDETGEVILVAPGTSGGAVTTGLGGCEPYEIVEKNGRAEPMTLTDLNGGINGACELSLAVEGTVTDTPPLKFGFQAPPGYPMKWLYLKAGVTPYLEGAPIVLELKDGASTTFGGKMSGGLTISTILTIHAK
jgi:hypothetical protein